MSRLPVSANTMMIDGVPVDLGPAMQALPSDKMRLFVYHYCWNTKRGFGSVTEAAAVADYLAVLAQRQQGWVVGAAVADREVVWNDDLDRLHAAPLRTNADPDDGSSISLAAVSDGSARPGFTVL